jgi:hypothetical protein
MEEEGSEAIRAAACTQSETRYPDRDPALPAGFDIACGLE